MQDNTAFRQRHRHLFPNILVKPTQRQITAIYKMRSGTKTIENTGEFQCNIAAAIDQNIFGKLFKIKRFV